MIEKKLLKEVGAFIKFEQLQLINIDGVVAAFPVSEKDIYTQDVAMKMNQCAVMGYYETYVFIAEN